MMMGRGAYDEQHKVFQHAFEMAVAGDGDGAVDEGADEGPDEAGHGLGPARHQLQAEGYAVDVRAVVGDDAEGEDDEAELAEAAEGWEEHRCEQAADPGRVVAVRVGGVDCVQGGGRDGQTEHFGEAEGDDEAAVDPEEGLGAADVGGLVDSVVGCVAGPACAETEDGGCEREDAACFGAAAAHGEVDEFAAVPEFTKDDEEDDGGGDPGVEFVEMHHFVAENRHDPGCCCYDYDASVAWNI